MKASDFLKLIGAKPLRRGVWAIDERCRSFVNSDLLRRCVREPNSDVTIADLAGAYAEMRRLGFEQIRDAHGQLRWMHGASDDHAIRLLVGLEEPVDLSGRWEKRPGREPGSVIYSRRVPQRAWPPAPWDGRR